MSPQPNTPITCFISDFWLNALTCSAVFNSNLYNSLSANIIQWNKTKHKLYTTTTQPAHKGEIRAFVQHCANIHSGSYTNQIEILPLNHFLKPWFFPCKKEPLESIKNSIKKKNQWHNLAQSQLFKII